MSAVSKVASLVVTMAVSTVAQMVGHLAELKVVKSAGPSVANLVEPKVAMSVVWMADQMAEWLVG